MGDSMKNLNFTRHNGGELLKSLSMLGNKELLQLDFWTIDIVSAYTGYSIKTIYNLSSRGEIPILKHPRFLYFIPHEIKEWMELGGAHGHKKSNKN